MPNFSKHEVLLVQFPFTDLSQFKVRPAVVCNTPFPSPDVLVVPLTSRTAVLRSGEFILDDWAKAGLNVPTAYLLNNSGES